MEPRNPILTLKLLDSIWSLAHLARAQLSNFLPICVSFQLLHESYRVINRQKTHFVSKISNKIKFDLKILVVDITVSKEDNIIELTDGLSLSATIISIFTIQHLSW